MSPPPPLPGTLAGQLKALAACTSPLPPLPPHLSAISTPMDWRAWDLALEQHADREFAEVITRGIKEGFRIGFNYRRLPHTRSASRNMISAHEHPTVVSEYIANECGLRHMLGPFDRPPIENLIINRFGVIPKRGQVNKWRLIVDLSAPDGYSVNDGINPQHCTLSYISVDVIAQTVLSLGRGCLLAKTDVKSAYRQVPVHPQDRCLLGMRWLGRYFVDATLPFGLRSAPLIFSAVADALEWVVRQAGVRHIYHYIDDFVLLGPPRHNECADALLTLRQVCDNLGVRIAEEKTEGPATTLVVLGIEIDTVAMTLRLPPEKLERLQATLTVWHGRSSGQRRDLESLVGQLQHAAKVVRPGRAFVRRIYELLAQTRDFKKHYLVRLNSECRADIEWWVAYCSNWNGVSILRESRAGQPDVHLHTDASGAWGCGAIWQGQWFQVPWEQLPIANASIAPKELFPIMLACAVWGRLWSGSTVCAHCDNMAAVDVVNKGRAREPLMCHQLRALFYMSAHFNFELVAQHTPGRENGPADALSRNDVHSFFSQVPSAASCPSAVPLGLRVGLSRAQPHWRSADWINWFRSTIAQL